ncbi:MlaD family protein [Sphingobium sp. DC-2]|uniref:MlaD family protein n=1 Tax=Sphingobium sp. DC-2 TaxID=1303256 RepID=UPI0004C3A203|nr:MlaD family protein [Sphingobium sp. DC-2]
MERHANYFLIGILTTLLVIGGLVFVVWLGGSGVSRETDDYQVLFQGPVRGLGEGGDVQFNGIKVGEIKRVRLAPGDSSKILVDIRVGHDTPVRDDSLASTELQGISGVNALQISAGTPTRPLLKTVSKDDPPLIRSKPRASASIMDGGGQVLERINNLLSDRNIDNITAVIADLRATSGKLAQNRHTFDRAASAVAKLDRSMDDVQVAVANIRGIVNGDGRRTFANAADAMEELKVTIAEARGAVADISNSAGKVGSDTLPAAGAAMHSLEDAADELKEVIRQIRQDPRATLTRGSGKERKVEP